MAANPLFVADLATLKASLRLTGAGAGTDADRLINNGILSARLAFYRRLGAARIAEILTTAFTEGPTSTEEYIRVLAHLTEVLIVRREVRKTMAQLFMDASADTQEAWNTEGAFRQGKPTVRELKKEEEEIAANMAILALEVEPGDEVRTLATFNVERETSDAAAPLPGDSLFRGYDSFGIVDRTEEEES